MNITYKHIIFYVCIMLIHDISMGDNTIFYGTCTKKLEGIVDYYDTDGESEVFPELYNVYLDKSSFVQIQGDLPAENFPLYGLDSYRFNLVPPLFGYKENRRYLVLICPSNQYPYLDYPGEMHGKWDNHKVKIFDLDESPLEKKYSAMVLKCNNQHVILTSIDSIKEEAERWKDYIKNNGFVLTSTFVKKMGRPHRINVYNNKEREADAIFIFEYLYDIKNRNEIITELPNGKIILAHPYIIAKEKEGKIYDVQYKSNTDAWTDSDDVAFPQL